MDNLPDVRVGLVAVSRDCFPRELSEKRRRRLGEVCAKKKMSVEEMATVVEKEEDVTAVLKTAREHSMNALVIYLGNFGPEGPASLLAQRFPGPVMMCAAAEETGEDLIQGRGDAYCGLLSASYNLGLRGAHPYIPEVPVDTAEGLAGRIQEFILIARVVSGISALKIFTFGPRPYDFLACNAPIKPLYDLGVEIMENSELDLYDLYMSAENHPRIESVAGEMARELGEGNRYPDLLKKLARYELALTGFMEANLGASRYGVFANKCWPAFEKYFGFVPCYINSRLARRGIPVACEVDIYGALSEYMAACATGKPPTLLDINNTVPQDMIHGTGKVTGDYRPTDLFMGFHCGNTPSSCLVRPEMKYQLIMHRLQEPDKEPDVTRGTLEGRIRPGEITLFRLQSTADTVLRAYIAHGEVLDMETRTFGGTGVFAVPEMARFYRHVLIEKRFPHHTAVAFSHAGKVLFEALKMLGVGEVYSNRPAGLPYPTENPF
jgi:L-fucose isomerase-like protein